MNAKKQSGSCTEGNDDYLGDYVEPNDCWNCGGEGFVITCCDDMCHGQGYCMHGDGEDVCGACHGEGCL